MDISHNIRSLVRDLHLPNNVSRVPLVKIAKFMTPARRAIRFPLEVPVAFWWNDASGITQHGEGRSRDISESGVFILGKVCPPLGARVGLRIFIEELPNTARAIRVQIDGHVLRVANSGTEAGTSGFAVLSDRAVLKESNGRD